MNCDEAKILLHGLVDDEFDAEHAGRIETHVAACARCAGQLRLHRAMRAMMSNANLQFSAPPGLRARIRAALPVRAADAPYRLRTLLKGFAFGSALSAAAAALLMIAVIRSDQDQVIVSDVVSAHLRSLQADHLTDVQTSDQHGVKPWFSDRLGVAPPVPDLTAQGFSLIGGRIDYVLGKAVAAIVYRRSDHVINLFVAQGAEAEHSARAETMQGFNVELWSEQGLNLCAVGDVSLEELQDFRKKFEAAAWAGQI
jgi:anti-sigma factor (TIGR02949 family)